MSTREVQGMSPTKRALLEQRLRGGTAAPPTISEPVSRRTGSGPAPLSIVQEQLWYFYRLAPDNPVFNEAVSIRKEGKFDVTAFRAAFNEIVRRHEIWRSTFEVLDGEPAQVVHPAPTWELPVVDLSAMPAAERELEAVRMAGEEARRPYDLARGPLLRPLLIRFTEHHHRLYLALPHLIFDGVSLYRIILPELVTLYDDFRAGEEPSLPEPPMQYADYSTVGREQGTGPDYARRIDYWRQRLDGASTLQLPLDHPRPRRQRFCGAMKRMRISKELADGLRSQSRASGATLFQVLSAAYTVLLHRYSGQEDIVFGTVSDLRDRRELEQMVGYCLTPVVVRVDVQEDLSFTELLRRVRRELVEGLSRMVPFEPLVRELQPRRDPGLNPIFQASLELEPAMAAVDPEWSLHQMEAEVSNAIGNAKFDLDLELDERPEGHLDGRLVYNTDLFDAGTVDRMADHFLHLLAEIVAAPKRRVSELSLLDDADRTELLAAWGHAGEDYPVACLDELFEAQCARSPNAVAVRFEGQELSYGELNERANRLARHLRSLGVGPDKLVGLCLDRSLEMVASILAVLKAGGAYVPLDPGYPADRLAFMLDDCQASVLVTEESLGGRLGEHVAKVVLLDRERAELAAESAANLDRVTRPENLAYVIYTSGSTGQPKGVLVEHRNVARLFSATDNWFYPGAADRWTLFHSYAFDFSVWELWGALLHGGTLIVVPQSVTRSPAALAELLVSERVTVLNATPSLFAAAVDELLNRAEELSLRLVVFGGEALAPRMLRRWFERLGDQRPRLVNMYGITETTVHVTYRPLLYADAEQDRSPIGVPIPDLALYLLDGALSPVPPGVAGELFVGGAGVARGYLNRPELTAERFIQNPFGPGRLYRTGDRARWARDRGFSFEGRVDDQVKVRGFRIELGEIQAALIDHELVADAVVVACEDPLGDTRLAAYVVLESSGGESAALRSELRAALQVRLPEYMIPSLFIVLNELPLTTNGKLDRKALPTPVPDRASEDAAVPPRTATEAALVGIWRELLGPRAETIGIHDDFFDLGGHSLLVLRVLAEVEQVLGVEVPLKWFFESGSVTVAGLAAKIEVPPKREAGGRPGVSLEGGDSLPILFFVHPDKPSMVSLRQLVSRLGPDVGVEGLLLERGEGRFDHSESVEGLAQPVLDTILRMQPDGPYYIAGFMLGGLLAYEIAGRLRAAGQPVAWLGLLDAAAPAADARWLRSHYSLRQRALRQRQRGPRATLAKLGEVLRHEAPSYKDLKAEKGFVKDGTENLPRFDHMGAIKLGARYACVGHDVPMDLFATEDRIALTSSDSLGWEDVHRGTLRVHRVAMDHFAMVTGGHVYAVARLNALYARAAEIVSTDVNEARRVWETS